VIGKLTSLLVHACAQHVDERTNPIARAVREILPDSSERPTRHCELVERQPRIIEGVLYVPAIHRDLIGDHGLDRTAATLHPPWCTVVNATQARPDANESRGFGQPVIVSLRRRIRERVGDPFA
jgi:hypothetical protein